MQFAFDFGASSDEIADPGVRSGAVRQPRSVAALRRRPPVFQPVIPGLERSRHDTLFFGLQPDGPAAADIENRLIPPVVLCRGLTGKPLGRLRWHVTLLGLGSYDSVPRALVASASEAAARLPAAGFEVRFDRVMSFPRRDPKAPLVLLGSKPLPALHDFRRSLARAMSDAGLRVSQGKTFTPHLTLLYDTRTVPECAVPPVAWRVRDFVLIHSLHGRSRHIVLGRWPLQ